MNMAKRKYSKMKKIEPAVQKLWFAVPNWDGISSDDTNFFIDLSQCASLANRRFYRQGVNWAVGDITLHVVNQFGQEYVKPGQSFGISKLPNTWVMSNAWEKSFRAWQKMIKEAVDDSGSNSIKGKFLDFKIYADSTHHQKGFDRNLIPIAHQAGQWQPSEIEIPQYGPQQLVAPNFPGETTTFELIAVGPNNPGAGASGFDAKSMIAGYAKSRALPYEQDPNVPDEASDAGENWMMSLFNQGTEQDSIVINTLETTGDKAPYPFENDGTHIDTMYPGGENNSPILENFSLWNTPLSSTGTRFSMGGSNFPCGLIRIQNNILLYREADFSGNPLGQDPGTSAGVSYLEITLVPGNHRGYLCEPMTEM